MADNVPITAGAGTSIATDEVGGAHYQRVKVVHGADGVANDASAATPLPVSSASDTVLGTTADAAVDSDAVGTISGKLRGLVKILAARLPTALTGGGGVKVGIVDALPAGTAEIGKLGAGTAEIGKLAAGSAVIGTAKIATSAAGGWTPTHLIATASANLTLVKNAAGQVGGWYISNHAATWRYVKLFNKASAPDPSADSALCLINIAVPPGGAANVEFAQGIVFGTGIGYAITGAQADNDETNVTAGDVVLNLLYA
jgi:hypothetical protein